MHGNGRKVWEFTQDYMKKYNELPDIAIVEAQLSVTLPVPPPAPEDYFTDEILDRRLYNEIGKQLAEVDHWHRAQDPHASYAAYEDGLRAVRKLGVATQRTVSLLSLGPDFREYYEKIRDGHRGVLTPWPTVNEATLGFWPEDFILYVARLGVGKTWALVIIANHAWSVQKKRVLFITTEMGREKIYQRWIAVHKKYPYDLLRKGMLGAFSEQVMFDWIEKVQHDDGLYIIGGDFDFRIESVEAAIEEREPDIIFLDGAYLLKVEGASRQERAANSYDELKRIAKRNHLPLVASTQFNREVKGNKTSSLGAEKIAMSDTAGWNADLIYGLIRTEDMVQDNRMLHYPLKFREGRGEDLETHWDFDTMNFDELPKGAAAAAAGGAGAPGAATAPAPDPDPDPDVGALFGDDADPF